MQSVQACYADTALVSQGKGQEDKASGFWVCFHYSK